MQALFSNTPMRVLGGLTVFMVFLAIASYAALNFEQMRYLDPMPATISVTGEGEELAVPDIGQFTFSVEAKADTAQAAQEQSGTAVNDILAFLRESGVAETDIKTTGYNLFPQYRWEERVCAAGSFCPPGERVADGFEVNQSVQVKVRDTASAPRVITGVGERGATNISGLNFVVDDTDALKADARAAAIADAQAKAGLLANQLGVRIVRLAGYYEDTFNQYEPQPFQMRAMGEEEMSMDFAGAELPLGEEKITASVTITYEVR